MFTKIITRMDEMGGVFKAPPITEDKLVKSEKELEKIHLALPDEYVDFLYESNGLYWAGLEFFGSDISTDKKSANITDLFSQNRIYQALNPDTSKVFLGRTDEDNFLYNLKTESYEIVDEFSGEVVKTFSSFEKLFSYIIDEQIELVQNYVSFNEEEIPNEEEDF